MSSYLFEKINEYPDQRGRDEIISKLVSEKFHIDRKRVIKSLISRRKLGPVIIGENFDLPHVEINNVSYQGLLLIKFVSKDVKKQNCFYSLVLIVDKTNPDNQVSEALNKMFIFIKDKNFDQIIKFFDGGK